VNNFYETLVFKGVHAVGNFCKKCVDEFTLFCISMFRVRFTSHIVRKPIRFINPVPSLFVAAVAGWTGSALAASDSWETNAAGSWNDNVGCESYYTAVGGTASLPGTVPAPKRSTLVLAGLGGLSLLLFHRRKLNSNWYK
jgi:hypothetical protein